MNERISGSRLEDPNFLLEFRNQLAGEIEKEIEDGSWWKNEGGDPSEIREGKKIAWHLWVNDKISRLGQDLRLSWDEIEELQRLIMEEKKEK